MYSENQLEGLIKEQVEGGTLSNAKPIYCHPISIDIEGEDVTNPAHLACLIFDNSNEEYNTYAKFIAKLTEIFAISPLAVFPTTGAIYYGGGASLLIAQKFDYDSVSEKIQLRAVRPNGTIGYFQIDSYLTDATFYDGVNKIN